MRILLLGGTRDARQLAERLAQEPGCEVIYSLAGATQAPRLPRDCDNRTGGFGGIQGLARYLIDTHINLVIDATHPFARQMSVHAAKACQMTGTDLIRYERKGWQAEPEDHWISVTDTESAFDRIAAHFERPFLALGTKETAHFRVIGGRTVFLRTVDRVEALPDGWHWIPLDPDASIEEEVSLFRILWVDVLVCRNSGGERTKLDAARQLKLPVIMIERPVLPDVPTVHNADEVLARLSAQT